MLKPFQAVGAQFLAERTRALLADEPGVGKTAQVVHACELVNARRVLVVCPGVGIEHWHREFGRWGQADREVPDVTVISYDTARMNYGELDATTFRWDVLVVDESHYAKNPAARRAHAIFGRGGFGWYADRIWCLSGTPAPNNAAELYPMLKAFGATKMSYEQFVPYFCRVDANGKVRGTRADHVEELRDMMKSYVLRRKKSDVLPELGAIDVQDWYVKPRPDFITDPVAAYDIAEEAERTLREHLRGKSVEDILIYLAGADEFSTLRRMNALLKAPAVFDQAMFEMENGLIDKLVIYGYHHEPLDILCQKFRGAGVQAEIVTGRTRQSDRDFRIQEWKRRGRVMLASIKAAGVVLDFTEAHQGMMLELDWVPGNNAQAMQRMHRQGQTMPVTVRVAHGSPIDELVNDVVLRKTRELSKIFS